MEYAGVNVPGSELETRYEILEALEGAGAQSWNARRRSTGQAVTLHRLGRDAGGSAELAELRQLD